MSSSDGVTLLDSISMRLQVIGESVKLIQKKNPAISAIPNPLLPQSKELWLTYSYLSCKLKVVVDFNY